MVRQTVLVLIILLLSFQPTFAQDCEVPPLKDTVLQHQDVYMCDEAWVNIDACCKYATPEACGYKAYDQTASVPIPTEGASGAAAQQIRASLQQTNRALATAAGCKAQIEKAHKNAICTAKSMQAGTAGGTVGTGNIAFNEDIYKKYLKVVDCWNDVGSKNEKDAAAAYDTYTAASGNSDITYDCPNTDIAGQMTSQCLLYNTRQASKETVSGDEQERLPVTTAQTISADGQGQCSGVISGQQMTTAAHCGLTGAAALSDRDWNAKIYSVSNQQSVSNPVVDNTIPSGSYDDVQTYDVPGANGKPVYFLGLASDPNAGCSVSSVSPQLLSCGANAVAQIQNAQATLQGYPADSTPYAQNYGQTVTVSRGPAYYNPNTNIFYVNGSYTPGMSGGAAYLDAGTQIGGVTLNRPLVLGNLSGIYDVGQPYTTAVIPLSSTDTLQTISVGKVSNKTLVNGARIFE